MNYFPDLKHLLRLLQELLERIKKLSSHAYTESNAFALNVLNRQRHELLKALDLLGWTDERENLTALSSTDNAILLCYHHKQARKFSHTDRSFAEFYNQGINGLQREVETFIDVVNRFLKKNKNV